MQTEINKSSASILVQAPRVRGRGEELVRTTLNVPKETIDRFERNTKGGKGICLAALLDFAMDTLEKNGETLTVMGG